MQFISFQLVLKLHENNGQMKRKLFFTFLFLCTISLSAKEGMWLPFLLEKMNEKEMKDMGMKMSAKDIYDIKNGSLKDAVVIFGGGCTGEVISEQGLVLTNHHCGYGAAAALSSVSHDYLTNGYWARNKEEELPCPGLSVTFIVNIIDVTDKVKEGVTGYMSDSTKNFKITSNIARIEKEMKASSGYDTQIKSFFYDNAFYLFLTEKFTDIRLVGFPPNGVGKFGGDTDNWAWPRHTGDFSLFRIYANKNNKPALYAKENQVYKPKRALTLNIGGVKEKDFTMVYGFPGRTQEYLTSDGVAEVMNTLDPIRIALREKKLNIMDAAMRDNKEIFIKYASKQAGIANYYKKWKGELLGLQINDAIAKKKAQEASFQKWVNEKKITSEQYGHVLADLATCYKTQQHAILWNEYINEAIWSSDLIKKGSILGNMLSAIDTLQSLDSLKKYQTEMIGFYKSIDMATDFSITKQLYKMYDAGMESTPFCSDAQIDAIYYNSYISTIEKFNSLLQVTNREDLKTVIQKDPSYKTYHYFDSVQKANLILVRANLLKLNSQYNIYLRALQEYNKGKQFYPDANSTLRVTYGKVEGAIPQDGMSYAFNTTLDGAIRKNNPMVEEFKIPEKLMDLYNRKDYGRYSIMQNGHKTVPLAFLASNHTTGGNSGSPVLNAKGELIGTNFDRIWEGTMSDILFDPNLCRNISVDIRYTLFIIEKLGDAKWVIDELKIVQ